MRITREALITRALDVLEEALKARSKGPVEPTLGLKLALAFLYAVSNDELGFYRHPRDVFVRFMDELQEQVRGPVDDVDKANRGCAYAALASLNGIRRRVGRY